ncbi:homeobox-leucine zipper protein PROTODERMAL FACTOR 2-like isoform X2 [Benincasa hispida]|uniref:homeobox-leucine zipper protein PROTODERMAL FACTOR 2-like isoform X2 n=1 Tax=Benincasa hispida TaxID=102211 RepID=UPI001902A438|nr:homeobox-leucine zipper protein PROTODERMAL FACTOR 2-like isoform X2 [Benincasa hispida]
MATNTKLHSLTSHLNSTRKLRILRKEEMFGGHGFEDHHEDLLLEMTQKNFEAELEKFGEDEFESRSVTDAMEASLGEEHCVLNQRNKRKRYHRHTQLQIQEMEAFFKECPHPDDKQRKQLSHELGLEPLQVKFWFQNKRTQIKAQQERTENAILKSQNEKLRAENMRYKEALSNTSCRNCGGPAALGEMSFDAQHLRIDNAHLRDEIERLNSSSKYGGKAWGSHSSHIVPCGGQLDHLGVGRSSLNLKPGQQLKADDHNLLGEMYGSVGDQTMTLKSSVTTEIDKPVIVELAVSAMEEVCKMAQAGEPLWVTGENSMEMLNEDEYLRTYSTRIGPRIVGLSFEASRQTSILAFNHLKLVHILMDVNQWSTVFCEIVSRASTLEVLSSGVGNDYNGALQIMTAELQVASPLVPTREIYFVRYCKQQADRSWAVVDVSLDYLRPTPTSRTRRRPSGCLIQELPNGYSKVTWVEHVEVDDRAVHNLYKRVVTCGLAFGAKRWMATLDRQCQRLTNSSSTNIPALDICGQEGRKSVMKLAERMVRSFCSGVGAATAQNWTTLSTIDSDDVRVMARKSLDDPGRPPGIVLNAATSFWIPILPNRVFHFLRDENTRNQWDILSNGGLVQEMARIGNDRNPGNCVSLLRVNSANSSQSNMLILQESRSDDITGSYIIYAPVDTVAMNVVLSGGDPDYVALLPSGFAILPDGPPIGPDGPPAILEFGSGGSLLTVAFQILVDSVPTAKLSLGSVATVNSLIKCTVERIRAALMCDQPMN